MCFIQGQITEINVEIEMKVNEQLDSRPNKITGRSSDLKR